MGSDRHNVLPREKSVKNQRRCFAVAREKPLVAPENDKLGASNARA